VHGGALELAVIFAFLEVLAFVELDFALADAEGDLDLSIFPIEGEREEDVALDAGQFKELANF